MVNGVLWVTDPSCTSTRKLHFRIPGHWWDEISSQEFDGFLASEAKGTSVYDLSGRRQAQDAAPDRVISPITGVLFNKAWKEWRANVITPTLNELCANLDDFTVLQSLVFEAWQDTGIQPPYIYASTIRSLCNHLPLTQNFTNLTLDISGFDIVRTGGNNHGCQSGICKSLGLAWPRVKHVRIRLKRYCEVLFSAAQSLSRTDVRCQSFILKLHHPPHGYQVQDSQLCGRAGYMTTHRLPEIMVASAQKYLSWISANADQAYAGEDGYVMPKLMRISYVQPSNVVTADCLTMRVLSRPEKFVVYEDDGLPSWYEMRRDLVDCGEFLPWEKRGSRDGT